MDSLTQVVLGAAVAEAAFGKKIGNKAILWGGVAGTIPDLDVIVSPFSTQLLHCSCIEGLAIAFYSLLLLLRWLAGL